MLTATRPCRNRSLISVRRWQTSDFGCTQSLLTRVRIQCAGCQRLCELRRLRRNLGRHSANGGLGTIGTIGTHSRADEPPSWSAIWLGGQVTRGACLPSGLSGLEQVEAVEPNACRCAPAVKACWTVPERAERTFIGPLLRPQEIRYRAIFQYSTQKLGLLPVPEQVVRAIVRLQPGRRPLIGQMHGVP